MTRIRITPKMLAHAAWKKRLKDWEALQEKNQKQKQFGYYSLNVEKLCEERIAFVKKKIEKTS